MRYPRVAIKGTNRIEMVCFPAKNKEQRERRGPQIGTVCVTGSRLKRTNNRQSMARIHLEGRWKKANEGKKQSTAPDHPTARPRHHVPTWNPETRFLPSRLVAFAANRLGQGGRGGIVTGWSDPATSLPVSTTAALAVYRRCVDSDGRGFDGFAIVWCSRQEGRWG